jgi:hypothetical protein
MPQGGYTETIKKAFVDVDTEVSRIDARLAQIATLDMRDEVK